MTQLLIPDADGVLVPHPLGIVQQTNEEYHSGPGISKSDLDLIARSPLHYWARKRDPARVTKEYSPALVLGSAIHSAVLEPDLFLTEYAALPDDAPKRPTSRQIDAKKPSMETLDAIAFWRDFESEHQGKTLLTASQMDAALSVRDAVHRHPVAGKLFQGGRSEQSVHAIDRRTGQHVKCRMDYWRAESGLVVDLKSTEDASPEGFARSVVNFRYHVQPAWYLDVLESAFGEAPPYWVFVAVEKTPPYAIGVYYVDEDTVSLGRKLAHRDFDRLLECTRTNTWPDYCPSEAKPLVLPSWYVRQNTDIG